MKKAFKADIVRELNKGGVVEFVWRTCKHTLITSDGQRIPMDGRTYSAFVTNPSPALVCSKTGDAEKGDLILVWRKIPGQPDTLIEGLEKETKREARIWRGVHEAAEYFVTINGRRRYMTFEAAKKFASDYFAKHGIVLGIEREG